MTNVTVGPTIELKLCPVPTQVRIMVLRDLDLGGGSTNGFIGLALIDPVRTGCVTSTRLIQNMQSHAELPVGLAVKPLDENVSMTQYLSWYL